MVHVHTSLSYYDHQNVIRPSTSTYALEYLIPKINIQNNNWNKEEEVYLWCKLNGIPKEQAQKLLLNDIDGSLLKDLTEKEIDQLNLTIGSKKN